MPVSFPSLKLLVPGTLNSLREAGIDCIGEEKIREVYQAVIYQANGHLNLEFHFFDDNTAENSGAGTFLLLDKNYNNGGAGDHQLHHYYSSFSCNLKPYLGS